MVKCAAANCRSGYRPTKAESEMFKLRGNVRLNRSVFAFPNVHRKEIRKRWIDVLKLKSSKWNPDNFGVCERHFQQNDFFDQNNTYRKTGRQRKALKLTAVPSIFDCYPESHRPKLIVQRPTTMFSEAARRQADNLHIQKQNDSMFQEERVNTIDEMWDKLLLERLPAGYTLIKMTHPEIELCVITIRLEELDNVT